MYNKVNKNKMIINIIKMHINKMLKEHITQDKDLYQEEKIHLENLLINDISVVLIYNKHHTA